MSDIGGVRSCLARMSDTIRPWRDVEAEVADHVSHDRVYLGGDGLRPYALWQQGDHIHLCHTPRAALGNPPLVDDILSGAYGLSIHDDERDGIAHLVLPSSAELAQRLDVPTALIVGLGDAERYRGARLALGIARLGQWLRFTHAARTQVYDYNLLEHPLDAVEHFLVTESPDLVGLGVNFGQWHQLAEIADVVNNHPVQAVVLGNILAAYDPERVAEHFKARENNRVMVATTLGEMPLQTLCSNIDAPDTWDDIAGLVRPRLDSAKPPHPSSPQPVVPPPLIFPDDGLVAAVVDRAGQIALETSFGCNFGACTFCPRDHRGDGWSRGQVATVEAILHRIAGSGAVLSLVDEEFFGTEGLADPPREELPAHRIMRTCRQHGIGYEIYTRLEQIVDRRRSRDWNLRRATLLTTETATMRRIFVGVESGAERQLRRYGKGQTVTQIVDALRVGSALGVPMEFGFITFDPLLSPDELADNISFLARRDVIKQLVSSGVDERVSAVGAYLDDTDVFIDADVALYQRVAYMATELEVLAHSRYAAMLRRRHPHLTGHYDPSFARYNTTYADPRIGAVAAWCRVWTEGMFTAIYEARMQARSTSDATVAARAHALIERYRDATFTLLLEASRTLLPETRSKLDHLATHTALHDQPSPLWLQDLATSVLGPDTPVPFDLALLDGRRTT